jgi:hypothetical protein
MVGGDIQSPVGEQTGKEPGQSSGSSLDTDRMTSPCQRLICTSITLLVWFSLAER